MRLALSGASLSDLSLEDELAAAARAGFETVELALSKIWPALQRQGPEAVASALGRARLAVVAVAAIPNVTFRDAPGREAVTAQLHGAAALARSLGASWVLVEPGERPDGADARDASREAQDSLDRLCRVSERYDVGVALLPLGVPWASVRTLAEAARILEAVGRKALGLALDTFHLHLAGSSPDDIRHCRARWIALLRLSDAPEGERSALREQHRLPPGQGVAALCRMADAVRLLRADPPAVVHAPMPRQAGDAAGWAARLRERGLAVLRAPDPALR